MSHLRRHPRAVMLAAIGVIAAVVVAGLAWFAFSGGSARSDVREAAATRLNVPADDVEVISLVTHGACTVATIDVPSKKAGYAIAVRDRDGKPVVERLTGETLGDESDEFFDTDDPRWEYTCPAAG